ncbi:hypothetical protein ACYOEI_08710 [Singulisphaera rosea]
MATDPSKPKGYLNRRLAWCQIALGLVYIPVAIAILGPGKSDGAVVAIGILMTVIGFRWLYSSKPTT